MILITDNIKFAQSCLPVRDNWQEQKITSLTSSVATLAVELFSTDRVMVNNYSHGGHWNYLFAVDQARRSHYDILSKLSVADIQPPDRTLCCAATGKEFHGFKNRSWQAIRGNIHLSAFIKPGMEIHGDAAGFIVAAAIAALQTAKSFDLNDGNASIKWVNDILIDNKKIGGVLARLQRLGGTTESAVLGIGLNVSQTPPVQRDSYVPGVAAISDFVEHRESCQHIDAFPRLIEYLGMNIEILLNGEYNGLLDLYRQHSIVLGREVSIYRDTRESSSQLVAKGRVKTIGNSLELLLEGKQVPITNGRLKLD